MIFLAPILIIFQAVAHEKLSDLSCQNKTHHLSVRHLKNTYELKLRKGKQVLHKTQWKKIEIEDHIEPKSNQITDIYSAQEKNFSLKVRRPETPGPLKSVVAKLEFKKPKPDSWDFESCKLITRH